MKIDTKITLITGLTFTLFGVLGLLSAPHRFILPEFSIPVIIPIYCLIYFIANWKAIEGLFFVFYPLIFIHAFIEIFWGHDFNLLSFLSYLAPIILFVSTFKDRSIWKKLIWIPLVVATSLLCAISLYFAAPEYLTIFLFIIFVLSTFILVLNRKYLTLPQSAKQHYLILALSCALLVLSIGSHWMD
ncbi:hypothetical protein N9M27_03135 [Flavobacteriales bacterium]|nr:hypothetical protein [Flavobacteriales bacterium]